MSEAYPICQRRLACFTFMQYLMLTDTFITIYRIK